MRLRQGMAALMISAAIFGLAGCESAKDKAARHLASAQALAEKGDGDRALIEYRNVFKLDPENLEARRGFAAFLEARGDLTGAYGQFQALIDRSPQDQEALRGAARVAARLGNWPEAGRQAAALLALVPDDAAMTAIRLGAAYGEASAKGDDAARLEAARQAHAALAAHPDDPVLMRIEIDALARTGDFDGALKVLDHAEALAPEDASLPALRVSLLAARGDKAGVEATLMDMDKRFADPGVGQTLLRWYVANGQIDQAEAWLRTKALAPGQAGLQARVGLALFLQQFRSPEAALAEIDAALKVLAAAPAPDAAPDAAATPPAKAAGKEAGKPVTAIGLRVLRATIQFDAGQAEAAIAAMKALLAEPGLVASDETRMAKVTLARMQVGSGDLVGPRALVEEVLAEDAGNVEAAKLKAAWEIDADQVDAAVALLRGALESAPRDAQTMTLLAAAYGRAGNVALQSDMLAQAVEASGKAPAETLRYANFLAANQKYLPAETLLVDALRLAPDNLDLLAAMGDLYIRMKDWPRAEGVTRRLQEIGTAQARAIADRLTPAILAAQDKGGAALDYLKTLAAAPGSEGGDAVSTQAALIAAYLDQGKTAEARAAATALVAAHPGDAQARLVLATVKGATGDGPGALADLAALTAENPKLPQLWLARIRQSLQTQGAPATEPLIEEALAQVPDQGDILLIKAGILEQKQDIDGAIAIYERLYTLASGNLVVANNLASLLSSYKTDQASLDRAWTVARRLNGTEVPAFADTYGWLAHLRGQTSEALPYLEKAAAGLPQDALTQFHYAQALQAAGQADQARAQYAKVLALVPAEDTRAFVLTARKEAAAP